MQFSFLANLRYFSHIPASKIPHLLFFSVYHEFVSPAAFRRSFRQSDFAKNKLKYFVDCKNTANFEKWNIYSGFQTTYLSDQS